MSIARKNIIKYSKTLKLSKKLRNIKKSKKKNKKNKKGGGTLSLNEDKDYFTNIMSLTVSTYFHCNRILKQQIMKLYDVVLKCIGSRLLEKNHVKYNQFKSNLDTIFKKDIEQMTLQIFNVMSLQCVILLTELVRFEDFTKNNKYTYSNMSKYPIPDIINLYNNIIKINWLDYDKIILHLQNYDDNPDISNRAKKFFGILPNILFNVKNDNSCPIVENDKPIIYTLIGELSLLQILNSYAHNIYLIGIVTDMSDADGKNYTPFEFMHHDIIHRKNRLLLDLDNKKTIYEKQFINYLINNQSISKDKLHKITIILFLLMHESLDENILFKKKIQANNYDTLFSESKTLTFIKYKIDDNSINKSWTNTKFFGGLLPEDIFTRLNGEIMNSSQIPEYLESASTVFINEWNLFFETLHI